MVVWGVKLQNFEKLVEVVDLEQLDKTIFKRKSVGCIVLTKVLKILLQMRGENCRSFPGCISTFGGGIEVGEESIQALVRELYQELGANVNESEVISFGAITDAVSKYTELVYVYFWHDHLGTITGCYEGSPLYFDNIESVMTHPKVMDYVLWLLVACKERGLLA